MTCLHTIVTMRMIKAMAVSSTALARIKRIKFNRIVPDRTLSESSDNSSQSHFKIRKFLLIFLTKSCYLTAAVAICAAQVVQKYQMTV
jgi:hypothetical protein